jgi:hypothetical protein
VIRIAALSIVLVFGSGQAFADTCADELGADGADTLVDQCEQVSQATHPPCNASNSCDMIRSEIKRGCRMLERGDRPDFCLDLR